MRVEVTTADGRTGVQDSTFYTNNVASSIVNIDSPSYGSTYSGTQVFGGWAIDGTSTVTDVNIFVDGSFLTTAVVGVNRSDVCAVYSGSPGCPNVGWDYSIDTSQLTNGTHVFTAAAVTADGRVTRATVYNVNISNTTGSILDVDWPTAQPLGDAPYAVLDGINVLGGWSVNTGASLSSVSVTIDGVPVGSGGIGSRQDVCDVFADPGCPYVGWSFGFDTGSVADGLHQLAVTSVFSDYSQATQYTPFLVQNTPSPYTEYESGTGGAPSAQCNTPDLNLSSAALFRTPGKDSKIHIVVDDDAGLDAIAPGAPLQTALNKWNNTAVSNVTQIVFDNIPPETPGVSSTTYDLKIKYDTSPNQTLSEAGCAAYDPVTRTIWWGNRARANTPDVLAAVLAHEIGHYLGLQDVIPHPAFNTLMNQAEPGSCSLITPQTATTDHPAQTTDVQASDAAQVTTCRATTMTYAKDLAKAQLSHNPQPPITVTVATNPVYYPAAVSSCTFTYSIVNYYVNGVYDSSETFVTSVSCH